MSAAPPLRVILDEQLQIPFSFGIYLALNAIRGARLVMDGPMCAFYKAEFIQGNHQLDADLQRHASLHRVLHSELDIQRVILGDEGLVREKLLAAGRDPETQVVLFAALSSAVLIGRDMQRLVSEEAPKLAVPLVPIPARAFFGDWLDGYAETLNAIASRVDLPARPERQEGRPLRVGIVGHLFTRHEGDATGDADELRRLCAALGVEVVSLWLSGQTYSELSAISQADLLLSLPYARKAAKTLAERLDVPLLEQDLPFSITETERFATTLAAHLGCPERAVAFLEDEKKRYATAILLRAERHLLGSRWIIACDSYRVAGWRELARDFGASIGALCLNTRKRAGLEDLREERITDGRYHSPESPLFMGPQDMLIGDALFTGRMGHDSRMPVYETGFPCFARHPIGPAPTFGVVGEALLAEDLALLRRRPSRA